MSEQKAPLKLIFTGPPGVGKTTAIAAISDIPPINTDVTATDEIAELKEATTAAMDYGELTLANGEKLFLYGTPGQERFDFMWKILADGSLGLIILIDNSRPDPIADLALYLDSFSELLNTRAGVIGITRASQGLPLGDFFDLLTHRNIVIPILEIDARIEKDVLQLLDAFLSVLEYADAEQDLGVT